MKTQVHKLTVMIVDHDHCGAVEVQDVLENARYPNRCIDPAVLKMETVEVLWTDDHPLNHHATQKAEFERLFVTPPPMVRDPEMQKFLVEVVTRDIQSHVAKTELFAILEGTPLPNHVENPEHDSLFSKFEQLEHLLECSKCEGSAVYEAITLARLIRAQVLK